MSSGLRALAIIGICLSVAFICGAMFGLWL